MNTPSPLERWIEPLVQLARRIEPWAQSLVLLAARLYLLDVFFKSGLTKVHDWEATLFLFTEEYHVPVLPPVLAAWMGTGGELVFSSLLAIGLFSRPAAVGVFMLNAVAAFSYPDISPAGLKDHVLWAVLSFALVVFGPGRLALDAWLMPRLFPSLLRMR
ncbi:DoxX family protein [Aquabacterium sp.]|uniref:DoxX family protein n=1 Tax=Aquabacterium sp. TaxID=1872578 RepID=UPI003D6D9E7A